MTLVPVYELYTRQENGHLMVTFRRFRTDRLASLPCHRQDIISHHPLQVKLNIPPGARISDMHQFEGKDIILKLIECSAPPLDAGEQSQ